MSGIVPVVLFAYARPDYLQRTLASLRENNIPLIYAFSDGPKTSEVEPRVHEVREILHQVNWSEIHIVEREKNLGLGTSILTGVTEVFQTHASIIVFEDDLICVPGTYQYLCAALEHYQDDPKVMSVTGWTHPRATPSNVIDQPYFDGRAEFLVWGTWKRAWYGMEQDALALMNECKKKRINVYRYGADLVKLGKKERASNLWAVRFLYLHISNKGLCLRPPYSLVQHIGYGPESTTVKSIEYGWHIEELPDHCPKIPEKWPPAKENPECSRIWRREHGRGPTIYKKAKATIKLWVNTLPAREKNLIKRIIEKVVSRRISWNS